MSGPRKPGDPAKPIASDEELLKAAAKVKRPSIFTRGPGPKDISPSSSPDDVKKPSGFKPDGS